MTYFLRHPEGIFLRSDNQLLSVERELEIATYVASVTPLGEFYLQKTESFTRPKKTYGTVNTKAARIMNTFEDRPNSTGVLLSGEQGSGKTMLARELSLLGQEKGIATIIVNSPFCGTSFNQFIQMVDVPAIIIIDEFEKMYDDADQQKMLTLLDGLFPTKKLFVLTCNNVYRIDQHMLNRPGRIFYHLKYEGLEREFITEYCADVLIDKEEAAGVLHISGHFRDFNFDMLKAIVEEMNRYSIGANEAVEMLNVLPSTSTNYEHIAELKIDDAVVKLYDSEVHCNPLDGEAIQVMVNENDQGSDDDEDEAPKKKSDKKAEKKAPIESPAIYRRRGGMLFFQFSVDDLVSIEKNVFIFKKDNAMLTMVRQEAKKFKFSRAF